MTEEIDDLGIPKSELYEMERDELQRHASETANPEVLRKSRGADINAAQARMNEFHEREFRELYPGEEIPDDPLELSYRVQVGLGIFKPEDYEEYRSRRF